MRKVILIFGILLLTTQMTFAQNGQDVTLTVEIDDNHQNSNGGFNPTSSLMTHFFCVFGVSRFFRP